MIEQESIGAIEKLGGKNQPDLSDAETLQKIFAEAVLRHDLERQGSEFYARDGKTLYTGWVKTIHRSNHKMQSLFYTKDGKLEGLWTRWSSNGSKREEATFRDGAPGAYTKWHKNGQKAEKATYKDGKREGLWTEWDENGQKELEVTYKDGKREGPFTWWHDNGQKAGEVTYKDGKKEEGGATTWHKNGQKKTPGTYKDGALEGVATKWDEDGTVVEQVRYKNGVMVAD
jgi:antitoxin component YwqK of YwqJK toxin-antitoxin module